MTPDEEAVVVACANLAYRAGATGMELGYLGDPQGPMAQAQWYAYATYRGARIMTGDHTSPAAAAMALAIRLLAGATCRCGQPVTLTDAPTGCRWTLDGKRWEPGCDAPPIRIAGADRGDRTAMIAALWKRQT